MRRGRRGGRLYLLAPVTRTVKTLSSSLLVVVVGGIGRVVGLLWEA